MVAGILDRADEIDFKLSLDLIILLLVFGGQLFIRDRVGDRRNRRLVLRSSHPGGDGAWRGGGLGPLLPGVGGAGCNTRFIKEHKPSNHIRARIKSHVYTTE